MSSTLVCITLGSICDRYRADSGSVFFCVLFLLCVSRAFVVCGWPVKGAVITMACDMQNYRNYA